MSAHRPGQLAGHVGASKERSLRQSIGINKDLQTLFKTTQSHHTLHIIFMVFIAYNMSVNVQQQRSFNGNFLGQPV